MKTLADLIAEELRVRLEEIVNPLDMGSVRAKVIKHKGGGFTIEVTTTFKTKPDGVEYTWGEWITSNKLADDDGLEELVSKLMSIAKTLQFRDMLPKK